MLKQEGYDLMGAAFEDYSVLGYGMAEEIYQQSFEIGTAGYPKLRRGNRRADRHRELVQHAGRYQERRIYF